MDMTSTSVLNAPAVGVSSSVSCAVLDAPAVGVSSSEPFPMGSTPVALNMRSEDFGNNNLQGGMLASCESLTPFFIDVDAGEDAMRKIMEFCRQVPDDTVFLISASGTLSLITVSLPYIDKMIYEGRFDILGISGSFAPTKGGGCERQGSASITFAQRDDKVRGGVVVGQLIAANSVRITVGTYRTSLGKVTKQKRERKDKHVFVPVTAINYVQENDANPSV